MFLIENRRLKSFLVAPPSTTFSPAAYPALRSYSQPRGYDPAHARTELGTTLALRALTLMYMALAYAIPSLLEQPRRSKMRWLSEWWRLLKRGAKEFFTASCSFGSVHRKEFVFLAASLDLSPVETPCTRDHTHIRIQGSLRAGGATCRSRLQRTPSFAEGGG